MILIHIFSGLNLLKTRSFSSLRLNKKVNQINKRSLRLLTDKPKSRD